MSLIGEMYSDLRAKGCRANLISLTTQLFTDPGFKTMCYWRASCRLHHKGILGKVASKLLWLSNVKRTSCYLSPHAVLGSGIVLPHPAAIVIGDGVTLGNRVTIFQSVTIGLKDKTPNAYPKIGDDVAIYSGACIIGQISIGSGCIIGANSVVLRDAAPHSVLVGAPATSIHSIESSSNIAS